MLCEYIGCQFTFILLEYGEAMGTLYLGNIYNFRNGIFRNCIGMFFAACLEQNLIDFWKAKKNKNIFTFHSSFKTPAFTSALKLNSSFYHSGWFGSLLFSPKCNEKNINKNCNENNKNRKKKCQINVVRKKHSSPLWRRAITFVYKQMRISCEKHCLHLHTRRNDLVFFTKNIIYNILVWH